MQPPTPLRALQQKLTLHHAVGRQDHQVGNLPSKGNIEDLVIDVNTMQQDDSGQPYKTQFLRKSEDGGEIEAKFFKKLDEGLNKVNNFYKDRVREVMHEATSLNKQMDALVAMWIKVENQNPALEGSSLRKPQFTDMAATMPLSTDPSTESTLGK